MTDYRRTWRQETEGIGVRLSVDFVAHQYSGVLPRPYAAELKSTCWNKYAIEVSNELWYLRYTYYLHVISCV